jgi:hypothetical protein
MMMTAKTSEPRYPDVTVQLTGEDGNAFAIMGAVARALREAGVPKAEVARYMKESMSGGYDDLLMTAIKWVDVR